MPKKIHFHDTNVISFKDFPRFIFEVTSVPSGLPVKDKARIRYDDRSIDYPSTNGSIWIYVFRLGNRCPVAHAVFCANEERVYCDSEACEPGFSGIGLLRRVKEIAEDQFECPYYDTDQDRAFATAFWRIRERLTFF